MTKSENSQRGISASESELFRISSFGIRIFLVWGEHPIPRPGTEH